MERKGETIIVGISIPKKLLAKIRILADKDNRSISNFISNTLSFLIPEEDSKCKPKK